MKNTWKKILCGTMIAAMLLGTAPMAKAAAPFTDVKEGAWYDTYVDYAYNNGLMAGTSDTAFNPNQTMTRGMLVTVLHSMAGKPAPATPNPFSDVGDAWYSNAVSWCYEHGVAAGTSDTTFSPNQKITREQMVTILHRYAETNGADVSKRADLSGYSDLSSVASYAADSFSWAVASGIIKGTNATTLAPKNGATRAECAVVLQRYHELLNGRPEPTEPAPSEPPIMGPVPEESVPTKPTHDFTAEELSRPVTEADIPRLEAYARSYAEYVGFIVDTSLNLDGVVGYYPAWAMKHKSLQKAIAYAEEGIEGTKESLIAAHGTIEGCGYNSYMEMTKAGLVMYHFYG